MTPVTPIFYDLVRPVSIFLSFMAIIFYCSLTNAHAQDASPPVIQRFNPPEDLTLVSSKKETSTATPKDAYISLLSAMKADKPRWQAAATVPDMRDNILRVAGGPVGERIARALNEEITRLGLLQIITHGNYAIVIGIKEHKPTPQNPKPSYSHDIFAFEKTEEGWLFSPRRSTDYPGCKIAWLGNLDRDAGPIDHYYCMRMQENGYYELDASIQNDKEFNWVVLGIPKIALPKPLP